MKSTARPAQRKASQPSYIVGLGASAGGLVPISDFFEAMPDDTGLAFVVVQHLSPDHKSLMSELLSRHTPMEVHEASEGMMVLPNCIYLVPNHHNVIIEAGKLRLKPKSPRKGPNDAINVFFQSLAVYAQSKAIAIVLSGTGQDGTEGLAHIKKHKGMVVVQDPMTAEFDGMPNSAIESGFADLVLPPELMPSEIMDFMDESPLLSAIRNTGSHDDTVINNILMLVRNAAQHDFSLYKRPTLQRRLAKRMLETGVGTVQEYHQYLTANPDEVKILSQEFLINVTKFFRDKDAFDDLYNKVLPELFKNKVPGDMIKVWSVACSSGEEPYSLAMLFQEYMSNHDKTDIVVKIFATDVDDEALELATRGVYPEASMKEVSRDRRRNFFIEDGKIYRVTPTLRKMVVFARHDITKDAPYSKVDLLCCRNMLIYMNPILQNSVLHAIHYAVKEKSYLFMGPSENLGPLRDHFEEINRKWKIFKCITKARMLQRDRFDQPISLDKNVLQSHIAARHKNALNHLPEVLSDTILEDNYAGVFIDKDLTVKQAVGKFKNFLNFPESSFDFNLLKLVPVDLSMALSLAVRNAIKSNEKVIMKQVKVHEGEVVRSMNIVVKPYLNQKEYMQPFLFVVLNETDNEVASKHAIAVPSTNEAAVARIDELEKELHTTRANLQSLVEQIESANEELQSSNEEMGASHEELQSTNEELQSLNEELHTVNAEHQQKIKELNDLNDDLNNYFNSSENGQIFIDRRLLIRKFSPAIKKQINVKDIDQGRSIIDISNNFKTLDFVNEIKRVMKSGQRSEQEVVMNNDKTFLMTINPYLRKDKRVDGVVINFSDVTRVRSLLNFVAAIFNASTNAIVALKAVRDHKSKIVDFTYSAINVQAEKLFKIKLGKSLEKSFAEAALDFKSIFSEVVEQDRLTIADFRLPTLDRWYQVTVAKLEDGVAATFADITEGKQYADLLRRGFEEQKQTASQLQSLNVKLERSNFDLMQFASVASHDLKEPLRKIQVYGDMLKQQTAEKLEQKDKDILDKILKSTGRMRMLIDDVLTFSKLSSETVLETVNLNSALAKIADDLEITTKEKGAELEIQKLPKVLANPGQIHQLFQNLISNGLKFNHKKKPKVVIREETVTKALAKTLGIPTGKFQVISVKDNGIGFDDQYADKIFGIFQRLNAVSSFEGTGIGLAVCKKIVDNHHGVLVAKSTVGKGSTFYVGLPATPAIKK